MKRSRLGLIRVERTVRLLPRLSLLFGTALNDLFVDSCAFVGAALWVRAEVLVVDLGLGCIGHGYCSGASRVLSSEDWSLGKVFA